MHEMATVAFLGLGLMGAPMAARLVDAGHHVSVWNRTPAAAAPLASRGATIATTPASAAAECEFAITMLADAAAVRSVLTGTDGLLSAPPGTLIQMSTVSPADAEMLARLAGSAGSRPVAYLNAPVLGSVPQARAGTLRILASGQEQAFDSCRLLLGTLGEPVYLGPGSGAPALKLVANAAVAPMVALLAESLALAVSFGLDEKTVLEELGRTRIGSLIERKRAAIETGVFTADSRLDLFAKDMRLVAEAGQDRGLAMRMTVAALALAEAAVDEGLGPLDYSVLIGHLKGRRDATE